jgi:hypothetical protein
MSKTGTLTRHFRSALLVVLATAVVAVPTPAVAEDKPAKMLPGARLLHKFPKKVYRIPVLLATEKGPRLLVWEDDFDPEPPRRPYDFNKAPEPRFDLIFWDVAANKQLHKMSVPKETVPLSPVPSSMSSPGAAIPFGTLAFSPDGKQLAHVTTTYKVIPGKPYHQPSTRIKQYNPAKRKWQEAIPTVFKSDYYPRTPRVLFAPDGALVFLEGTTCGIQEPGKAKPRKTFQLVRAPSYKKNPLSNEIRQAVLSPDASQLAVAADGMVTVYDLATGKKVFHATRSAPEAKTTFGQSVMVASLAFAPSQGEQKLLAVEIVTGPPKSFVLARVFDLKAKKEVSRKTLAQQATKGGRFGMNGPLPSWGRAHAYYTADGQPRILFDGKLHDGASGKVLHKFDEEQGVFVSQGGKYLVRLTGPKGDKTMGVEVWSLENVK